MSDREDLILDSLTRINDKLDKHDNKFDEISITLKKLVEVDMEMKELKNANRRIFTRLDKIEVHQNEDGCVALNNFWRIRSEQLKRYDSAIKDFDNRIGETEKIIKDLKNLPNKIFNRILFVAISTLTAGAIGLLLFDKH